MASWWIEYSKEAANYMDDNGFLVRDLFFAMEGLAETEGVPREGAHQDETGLIWWDVENHRIFYERREEDKIVVVASIKPLT